MNVRHDLLLLLEVVLPHCAEAETLRDDLASLMPYAIDVRYPDASFMPTQDDALEARRTAQSVLEWLKFHLSGLFL